MREGVKAGPYSIDHITKYVASGDILLQDVILQSAINATPTTVKRFLKSNSIAYTLPKQPGLIKQFSVLKSSIILPTIGDIRTKLFKDSKVILLFSIGLSPLLIIMLLGSISTLLTFYTIAVYFSFIWALFYLVMFKTTQVKSRLALVIFFVSQISTVLVTSTQVLPPFDVIYSITESQSILGRLTGYVCGVGLLEEVAKALPVIIIARHMRQLLVPKTLVFYGLISGLGFGTVEAVYYQLGVNSQLYYSTSYFMNVARLTTLPFIHSVWSGIACYFIAFRLLLPKYRLGISIACILIPDMLHGLYDTLVIWPLLSFIILALSVIILMNLLMKAEHFRSTLKSLG